MSSVSALLKKTEHYDKDERYMATSDLCEVLKRHASNDTAAGSTTTLDAAAERRICTAVLRLLHDKSNDVQAIAVKTLGVLLTTVQEAQVLEIADSLADQVLDASKSELRDVYAIGLRTLCQTIPAGMGDMTAQRLVGRLLDGIRTGSSTSTSSNANPEQEEITLACLDVLTDLLTRFGASARSLTRQHEPILQMCLAQLSSSSNGSGDSSNNVVRKRAGNTLGCLSVVLSDALLGSMVERLLSLMEETSSQNKDDTRALIRTMCTVSGAVGHRLGQEQMDRIIPIFLQFTNPEEAITGDDDDDDDDEDDPASSAADSNHMSDNDNDNMDDDAAIALANELRESCFMGLESFVTKCPTKVAPHLPQIIPAALAFLAYDPNYSYGLDENETDNDDEAMNDDEDDDYDMDDDDDDYGEEEDDDEDYDDDDESWKVRRSAIRALQAVVEQANHDSSLLIDLWTTEFKVRRKLKPQVVATALVGRFKEREEHCRVGVLDCFTRLLTVTVQAASNDTAVISFSTDKNDGEDTAMKDTDSTTTTVIDLRTTYAPAVVKGCEKLLAVPKSGGERSKSHALLLLSTLCQAPGGLGGQAEIASVFQHVQSFLADSKEGNSNNNMHKEGTSKTLRLDALTLVHAILESPNHDPVHVRHGLVHTILPQLCAAVQTQEQWYKVIAQALRALAAVPRFFDVDNNATIQEERTNVAHQLYTAMEPLLAAHDVDQEIKECALLAEASLLRHLHTQLSAEQSARLLTLLLERLRNETTRMAAIKTLSAIASASQIDLSPILADGITTLAGFLKLHAPSRSLKQSSLEALDIVLTHHGVNDNDDTMSELYGMVLQELSNLVVDTDLHLAHLSLRASISALKVCPPSASPSAVKEYVLPQALALSASSLLQDVALESLLALLEQVVASQAVDFHEFLGMLQSRVLSTASNKHAVYNIARCIAVITAATTPEHRQGVVTETLASLQGMETPQEQEALKKVQLALLVSGELGRRIDLSTITVEGSTTTAADTLQEIYMGYFESSSEDLKYAAAYALGRAAVGAQSKFLPAIVDALEKNNQKKQYLLLSALRGFIQCSYQQSGGDSRIATSLPVIMPHLETHAADAEEGVRTMVAECLGSLICMQPGPVLERLQAMVSSHSTIHVDDETFNTTDDTSKTNALVCWTAASSMKLAISGKADPAVLGTYMSSLLSLLQQKELSVRNAALLMVYSAVHHMPQLLVGGDNSNSNIMKELILPTLYEVAELKLTRKVDLGPFKHTVDDALPLRKAALSIFATCLETLPASLDIAAFLPVLTKALGDVEDVQLQAHQIVLTMCSRQPTYLVASVESLVEPLEKTIHKKQGQKTGTELERLNDWIKSALRAMLALSKIENGACLNNRKFAEFQERTWANAKFAPVLKALEEER